MEIWKQHGFTSADEFYKRYPNARRPLKSHSRKRNNKRAIIRKGKIIAKPECADGKYQRKKSRWDYPKYAG